MRKLTVDAVVAALSEWEMSTWDCLVDERILNLDLPLVRKEDHSLAYRLCIEQQVGIATSVLLKILSK